MDMQNPTIYPKKRRAIQALILFIVFTGCGWAVTTEHWGGWILAAFGLIGLLFSVLLILPGLNYLRLDGTGFEIRDIFKVTRFQWQDIETIDLVDIRSNGYTLVVFIFTAASGRKTAMGRQLNKMAALGRSLDHNCICRCNIDISEIYW